MLFVAPQRSSESGKRSRHNAQPQQKYRGGSAAGSPLLCCLAEGRCMHTFLQQMPSTFTLSSIDGTRQLARTMAVYDIFDQ